VPSVRTADLPEPRASTASASYAEGPAAESNARGRAVYEGACAGCHGWTGVSPVIPFATLTGTRGVNDPTAINVAQVIIGGAERHAAHAAANMPSFGGAYSDAEIASVANCNCSIRHTSFAADGGQGGRDAGRRLSYRITGWLGNDA
jgi:mono/diheme cytochrome c family protein